MFLKKTPNKDTGRIAYSIIESYRENGKIKARTAKYLGYEDELKKEHSDPEAWARELAASMTEKKKEASDEYLIKVQPNQVLEKDNTLRKNIGYSVFLFVYHMFELDTFWRNRAKRKKTEYDENAIFRLLVLGRLIYPGSKKATWEKRGRFFENSDFSLDDVYRSLDFFLEYRDDLLRHLNNIMEKHYKRDTLLLFYDVTNYYFEIDDNDEDIYNNDGKLKSAGIRKKGCSKENRSSPIVQMGLFMDDQGIPVSYELFAGNTHDSCTFTPMLDETFSKFEMSELITVADKGMMSGDNISSILLKHQGYVISNSVRKADAKFIEYIKDDSGYTEFYDKETGILEFKYKERLAPRYIWVTNKETKKKKKNKINERQIIIWSKKYADKAAMDREKVITKAKKLIGAGNSLDASTVKVGARKYIRKTPVSKEGEIIEDASYIVDLDQNLVNNEEALDGYYAICSNVVGRNEFSKPFEEGQKARYDEKTNLFELNKEVSALDILEMYRGLWKIEETFKVTKSDLEARPVYASKETRIRAHFLICFVSLLTMRFTEKQLGWEYSSTRIQESIRNSCATLVSGNLYMLDYYDDVLEALEKKFRLNLSKKYMTANEIRQLLAFTRKIK